MKQFFLVETLHATSLHGDGTNLETLHATSLRGDGTNLETLHATSLHGDGTNLETLHATSLREIHAFRKFRLACIQEFHKSIHIKVIGPGLDKHFAIVVQKDVIRL